MPPGGGPRSTSRRCARRDCSASPRHGHTAATRWARLLVGVLVLVVSYTASIALWRFPNEVRHLVCGQDPDATVCGSSAGACRLSQPKAGTCSAPLGWASGAQHASCAILSIMTGPGSLLGPRHRAGPDERAVGRGHPAHGRDARHRRRHDRGGRRLRAGGAGPAGAARRPAHSASARAAGPAGRASPVLGMGIAVYEWRPGGTARLPARQPPAAWSFPQMRVMAAMSSSSSGPVKYFWTASSKVRLTSAV